MLYTRVANFYALQCTFSSLPIFPLNYYQTDLMSDLYLSHSLSLLVLLAQDKNGGDINLKTPAQFLVWNFLFDLTYVCRPWMIKIF